MNLGRILRQKHVPGGFLGMLALVVLIEGTVRLNRTAFTSYNALSWAFTREHVATDAARAEIVCLGDSRAKYAVLPQVIRATTGRTAYNLAITAGRPASSFFLLAEALAAGARPGAIVVDFDDKLLADEPLSLDAPPPWSELLSHDQAAELERTTRAPDFTTRIVLEQLLHTFKNRYEIRQIVTRLVRGKGGPQLRFHEAAWRNWTVNEGAQVNTKRAYKPPPAPVAPGRHVEGTWKPHPLNVLYVERLLTLAQARAIPVYWLLTPRCPTVQLWREWYGEEWPYEQFAAKLLERFPNLVIIDARHSGYEADVFVDTVHLDRDGASTLSAELAIALEVLPTLHPKPRWAQLPHYRPAAARIALEDFEASRAAVKLGARGSRQTGVPQPAETPGVRVWR